MPHPMLAPLAFALLPDLHGLGPVAVVALVCGVVYVESGLLVGFFLPGDTVLFTAGLLAADPGRGLSLAVLCVGVAVAAVAGDSTGYLIGRRAGRPWLERRADKKVLGAHDVNRAERFFARFGSPTLVGARFIPWLRTAAPVLAGVGEMPYPRFLTWNALGGLLWGPGLLVLGFLAASHPALRYAAFGVAAASVLASVVGGVVRSRRAREARRAGRAARRTSAGSQPPHSGAG